MSDYSLGKAWPIIGTPRRPWSVSCFQTDHYPEIRIDTIDPAYYTAADGDGQTTAAREAGIDVNRDPRPVSNQSRVDLEAVRVRSYISEPDRGRRIWKKQSEARDAVYRNRRRICGARGQRLLRLRGERLEPPFAHLYETGGMRRVYLRSPTNIRKRVLVTFG